MAVAAIQLEIAQRNVVCCACLASRKTRMITGHFLHHKAETKQRWPRTRTTEQPNQLSPAFSKIPYHIRAVKAIPDAKSQDNDGSNLSPSEAGLLIAEGKQKFSANDRMGALRCFETAARQAVTQRDVAVASFNAAVVHASFGDAEPAQQSLREAVVNGLSIESAMQDPTLLKLKAPKQLMLQLQRFATSVAQQQATGAPGSKGRARGGAPGTTTPAAPRPAGGPRPNWRPQSDEDVSDLLSRDTDTELDASIGGIIRRVAILLVIGVALGVALFYLGLEYAFPKYE